MTIITQLYCQLYITYQLHVLANTILGHYQVGYNYRRELHNIYNMIQYNNHCWCVEGDKISNIMKS